MNNFELKNQIPKGSTDYYGKEAVLRDYILKQIEELYQTFGFEPLYTPIIENEVVFKGHHGEGEKLLFKLQDKNDEKYVLKYDSTVPLARVISMYKDIKLPYKRYQLQQSYRDDEIDKGHFREFIQCDGDVVGSSSLVTDSEFIMISYEGLKRMGFNDFTIRINHRKLIKAIAEKAKIYDKNGLLSIQRAIDVSDKINKGNISDIEAEMDKTAIDKTVKEIILTLIKIINKSKNINETLDNIEKYFEENLNAKTGVAELKEIISNLPNNVLEKVKLDFTLARGADYYTGFILEAVINGIELGAVLGGGRYDNLVEAFGGEDIPAVGLAFGMERLIVAMKELGLDKLILTNVEKKLLVYSNSEQKINALKVTRQLREKHNVTLIFDSEVPLDEIVEYCNFSNISLIAIIKSNGRYELVRPNELATTLNNNDVYIRTRKSSTHHA